MASAVLDLLKRGIFIPLANFKDAIYKNVNIASKFCNKAAEIVFKYSKETALIMLFGDAISIFSSHTEQIKGLRKSNRENKDILIAQERIERILDLSLNILPPFLITRFVKKKFESGAITTRDFASKLYEDIGPGVGAHRDELAKIDYIRPIKETIIGGIGKTFEAVSNNKKISPKIQGRLKNISDSCKKKIPNTYVTPSFEEITSYFDDMKDRVSPTIRGKLRNGSAYDEIQGMVNGICIASVITYSIVFSNILMPILKNKISTNLRDRKLKKMGETKESLKRKNRFAYTNTTPVETSSEIFNTFSTEKTKIAKPRMPEETYTTLTESGTFSSFNTYTRIASQTKGLRI